MSEIENAQSARELQDDELDLVSGGFRFEMGSLPCVRCLELENTMVSS